MAAHGSGGAGGTAPVKVAVLMDAGSSSIRATAVARTVEFPYYRKLAGVALPYTALDAGGRCDVTPFLFTGLAAFAGVLRALPEHPPWVLSDVALSCFVGNLVPLGAAGEVLAPAFTYASTATPAVLAAALAAVGGDAAAHHARSGTPLHAAYAPACVCGEKRVFKKIKEKQGFSCRMRYQFRV